MEEIKNYCAPGQLLGAKVKTTSPAWQLISGNEKIVIPALDGRNCLTRVKKTFKSFIDKGIKNWELSQSRRQITSTTFVRVGEVLVNLTFKQIFSNVSADLDKLVLDEDQIVYFCEHHSCWLRKEGRGTFFLTQKTNGEYLVKRVYELSNGIYAITYPLESKNIWYGNDRNRFVFPCQYPNPGLGQ